MYYSYIPSHTVLELSSVSSASGAFIARKKERNDDVAKELGLETLTGDPIIINGLMGSIDVTDKSVYT